MASRQAHWQLLLREYTDLNPEEKKRIANTLNVNVRTIDRWIAGTTDPSRPVVPRLARVVPGKEAEMRLSLEREYPSAFERASEQELLSNIPSPFYARALEAKATLASNLSRNAIMGSVLRQMCGHLDPDEDGLIILFAQCVKPLDGEKVTSLMIHSSGYGTNKWQYQQTDRPYMFGSGSLCAMAVMNGSMALYPQDIARIYPAPILHSSNLKSCAAFPVLREGNVAGALFVGATQLEFFSEARRELIKSYSYSFALSLRDQEFYPADCIDLQSMPTPTQQSAIYRQAQQFLDDLAEQYPDDTPEQLEQRAKTIFHDQCHFVRKDSVHG